VAAARDDLGDLLGVRARPAFTRVRRRARATPIYEVGHRARVARIAELTRPLGALALAGNAYRGIGIPDCIASGEEAAGAVVSALGLAS
jgi:oxygen-dependent protoporphyrinogen oxidase